MCFVCFSSWSLVMRFSVRDYGFSSTKMSDNILRFTLPLLHSDGSVEHKSHDDESPPHSEGKKRKTRSHMWNNVTKIPGASLSLFSHEVIEEIHRLEQ
ncbi:hypothetical protein A2U01_0006700, partial [Trifolium medium]|nr:hypothetical protein [Trifolium medium]